MKRIIAFALSAVLLFSLCFVPCYTVDDYDCPRFYLKLADGYSEGDTTFAVELHANDEYVYGISYFGFTLDYTLNVVLRESVSHYSGVWFSKSVVETPYHILGVATEEDFFVLPYEDTVMATFYFDIIDVGYEGPVEITLSLDSENGVGDAYGESLNDEVIVEGLTLDIVMPDDGSDDTEEEEEIPDFDDLNYTGSDMIYLNENFMTAESFAKDFLAGAFYIEDGLMCGWAEAKALQSAYTSVNDMFDNNSPYVWRTYDMSMTLSLSDDETSSSDRWLNICYCNDNMIYAGTGSDRQFITFSYDFGNKCFRLANGWNNASPGGQFMSPVYKEICADGSEFINIGMSVSKDRIRCYYNGDLIFDYTNSSFKIAHSIGSPFFLWNEGNVIRAKNITVAEQGYFFPLEKEPLINNGYVVGSDGLMVSYYGGDTAEIPDTVSRIGKFAFLKDKGLNEVVIMNDNIVIEDGAFFGAKTLTVRCYPESAGETYAKRKGINCRLIYPGDVNDNGIVDIVDIAILSRFFVGGRIALEYGADVNRDGKTDIIDVAFARRNLT